VITSVDITNVLRELGVGPSDTVFVHSDVSRCLRVAGRTRKDKLETVLRGLADSVPEGTLIMPTFSYSFCRHEVFHLERSPSTCGVLTEYFRGRPGVRRTADPIFSAAVLGPVPGQWERELFGVGDKDCFGPQSIFAYLLEVDAHHVCLDTTTCTFIHHVGQREGVPYRYFKEFRGVVAQDARVTLATARYFVRPLEDEFEAVIDPLARTLLARGRARAIRLERGPELWAARAGAIAQTVVEEMEANPEFLLRRGHRELSGVGNG